MSSFSQTEHFISELPQLIEFIQTKIHKVEPSPQTPFNQLEPLYQEAAKLNKSIENANIVLQKAVKRAEEKEPDQQIYGQRHLLFDISRLR